jgi:hypothetical protein
MDIILLLFLAVIIFIVGMIAAWVVRLMIRQEVVIQVDREFDERGIVHRRGR